MADKLRLLIVDDSKIALAQLGSIIGGIEGAEVTETASDGVSAIRCAAGAKPDLILMDIVMPEMDGLSALRMLHAKDPDVRVAMVSSLGGSGSHAEEAFRLGAIQVIGKPFDVEQIESLISAEINHRAQAK
ncbi:MAG: YesN/AraC family two-component response regulator [Myxococcota bacterium]|jgi:YesN/AraC family two-component response regulator